MIRRLIVVTSVLGLFAALGFAQAPVQVSGLSVFHRSGQTFLTWNEVSQPSGVKYRIYRASFPISVSTLGSATLLAEVPVDSARLYTERYWNTSIIPNQWSVRWVDRMVLNDFASPLAPGIGCFVWTLAAQDLLGLTSGVGYYAVTSVGSNGIENTTVLSAGNVSAGLPESLSDPLPVEILNLGATRVFLQYVDLRQWNATFHAPRVANSYYGLPSNDPGVAGAIQYAFAYAVQFPTTAACAQSPSSPRALGVWLHGHQANAYPPTPNVAGNSCQVTIYPLDIGETWWFGFAKDHDYRTGAPVPAGDVVLNATERRVLRMVHDLRRHLTVGPTLDSDRTYVSGGSMGGSGALAFALRYPNVFAAAYCNQPMTNYQTCGDGGGFNWRPEIEGKWGARSLDLPVQLDAPAGFAAHLAPHNGTGVWSWQDHRSNLLARRSDEVAPIGINHGTLDTVIEWPTQGAPVYPALEGSGRCFGGIVDQVAHGWQGWNSLPPTLANLPGVGAYFGMKVRKSETVPGLSLASTNPPIPGALPLPGRYNLEIEWSSSWNPWDGAPVESASLWRMSFRSKNSQTLAVSVTPRRCQVFPKIPWKVFEWTNRSIATGAPIQNGLVLADGDGLVTVPAMTVTPGGTRLEITPAPYTALTSTLISGSSAAFVVYGATPQAPQVFFASLIGFGLTPYAPLGVTLWLDSPIPLFTDLASPGGLAVWYLSLPLGLTGVQVYFQSAESGRVTPPFMVTIL